MTLILIGFIGFLFNLINRIKYDTIGLHILEKEPNFMK